MIQALQIALCSLPVVLAALVTLYPSLSFVRRAFSLSRKGLKCFVRGLGVATLIDLCARAIELETWQTDDGLFSRSKKLQLCFEKPEWASYNFFGGRMCEWSLHYATGSVTGQSVLFIIQAVLAIILVVGQWHPRKIAFALYILTDSLHNFVRLSHGGVGAGFINMALFWAWQLPLPVSPVSKKTLSKDREDNDKDDHEQLDAHEQPIFTPATCGFVLSICMIYWDCVIARLENPTESAWLDGSALIRALLLSRYRTARWFVFKLENVPAVVFQVGTYISLFMEMICPFALLIPGHPRTMAVISLACLFLGIFMLMALGADTLLCSVTLLPFLFSERLIFITATKQKQESSSDFNSEQPRHRRRSNKSTPSKKTHRHRSRRSTTPLPSSSPIRKIRSDDGNNKRTSFTAVLLLACSTTFALFSLWINVATHVCSSSVTVGKLVPGCDALQEKNGWLSLLWASPLSHGPWQMFSGIEKYPDWRMLSLVSDGAFNNKDGVYLAPKVPDECTQPGVDDGLTCLLNIEGVRNVAAAASNGADGQHRMTIGEHILRTNDVPSRDSFASFWWQDFWETVYFLDGGVLESYYMSADFHCRQSRATTNLAMAAENAAVKVQDVRRYYFILMLQKGSSDQPADWTSDWIFTSCECGKCGKEDQHSRVNVEGLPYSRMNKYLGSKLQELYSYKHK